jgi:hypothetical protein
MPALSYKKQFVEKVAAGAKPHSIRGWRRRPFREGDTLQHYTAMRTKACRKVRPDTICTAAVPIEINARLRYVILSEGSGYYPAGRLSARQVRALAIRDGFNTVADFWHFFEDTHRGILCGQLVEWNPFPNITFTVAGRSLEEGQAVSVGEDGKVYPLPAAPLSPAQSRPVATGKREPRGPDVVGAATLSPRGAK